MASGDPVIVLWPSGVNGPFEGFFYGWTSPLACIAGLIRTGPESVSRCETTYIYRS